MSKNELLTPIHYNPTESNKNNLESSYIFTSTAYIFVKYQLLAKVVQ